MQTYDFLTTSSFSKALQHAEHKAISDLVGQWCVTMRYGVFCACPLRYAEAKDYHVVSVTLY